MSSLDVEFDDFKSKLSRESLFQRDLSACIPPACITVIHKPIIGSVNTHKTKTLSG